MTKTAFVFPSPSNYNCREELKRYTEVIPKFQPYDVYFLCQTPNKPKILKKDIDLDFNVLSDYDIICPVGSDCLKHICGLTSITKYNGLQVDGKYFPLLSLAYVINKPQAADEIISALKKIQKAQIGATPTVSAEKTYAYIDTLDEFLPLMEKIRDASVVGVDIETTGLKYQKSAIIGINFSTKPHEGFFVDIEVVRLVEEELGEILRKKKCVFHNGKFDQQFLRHELGWEFEDFEDTMLLHYCLEEAVGTHGLKDLAVKYTDLGDYDRELSEFKKEFCKKNKIKLEEFDFGMIPIDILAPYGCKDGDATQQIFHKFYPLVQRSEQFNFVYNQILIPGSQALLEIELNGGPINTDYFNRLNDLLTLKIEEAKQTIKQDPSVKLFEKMFEKDFNPNSPAQLSKLFFEVLKIPPVKLTSSSTAESPKYSTDQEVLETIQHPLATKLLELRKVNKLKNTYINAILTELDPDGRLRSSFNLHGTVAGRLSSSGSLNYQNIPRKTETDDAVIKIGFGARPGYAIVQGDLKTAEVYIAAVLSNDSFLQEAFKKKLDFHSYIAKQAFNLDCEVHEVKNKYPHLRQVAKAITFGIMYQAGPMKIAEQANDSIKDPAEHITYAESKQFIEKYFNEASNLKTFIDKCNDTIALNKFIYSFFGRKRRLREVDSPNRGVRGHAIRSGVNFLIQSAASDINLFAVIDAVKWIKENHYENDILPFTIVHDSIVAEVKIELIPLWLKTLKQFVQKDRGLSIEGCPIEMDFEVGVNWGHTKEVPVDVSIEKLQEILAETQEKYDTYYKGLLAKIEEQQQQISQNSVSAVREEERTAA